MEILDVDLTQAASYLGEREGTSTEIISGHEWDQKTIPKIGE